MSDNQIFRSQRNSGKKAQKKETSILVQWRLTLHASEFRERMRKQQRQHCRSFLLHTLLLLSMILLAVLNIGLFLTGGKEDDGSGALLHKP